MKIMAKLLVMSETKQVSAGFKKREFVVEYAKNPQYPEYLKFELVQDKCGLLDRFSVGETLEIHFELKGRRWNDPKGEVKYFNSLQAWKLEKPNDRAAAGATFGVAPTEDNPPEWLEDDENASPF